MPLLPQADAPLKGGGQDHRLAGAGLRHVGQTWADNANSRKVDAYRLADLSLRYERNGYGATLGVTSLFGEDYYATCSAVDWGCAAGEGREVTLNLSRKF